MPDLRTPRWPAARDRAFKQVDVFTDRPFLGNPVAVVLDAQGLDSATMQRIARWTNLSETTFVLPPTEDGADYQVRIFTPASELPFAGHPTLGTAHALLEAGLITPRDGLVHQQCGSGLVPIRVDRAARTVSLCLPQPQMRLLAPQADTQSDPQAGRADAGADPSGEAVAADPGEALAAALGAAVPSPIRRVDVGPVWLVAELADAATVLALRPTMAAIAALTNAYGAVGVTVFGATTGGELARYEVRSFAPAHGIDEDPVCGSGNGSVAAWLRAEGRDSDYLARQGRAVARDGYVSIGFDGDRIFVGGACVSCIDGSLRA